MLVTAGSTVIGLSTRTAPSSTWTSVRSTVMGLSTRSAPSWMSTWVTAGSTVTGDARKARSWKFTPTGSDGGGESLPVVGAVLGAGAGGVPGEWGGTENRPE